MTEAHAIASCCGYRLGFVLVSSYAAVLLFCMLGSLFPFNFPFSAPGVDGCAAAGWWGRWRPCVRLLSSYFVLTSFSQVFLYFVLALNLFLIFILHLRRTVHCVMRSLPGILYRERAEDLP